MTITRYAKKLTRIRAGKYKPGDFILADAKDSDVTGGVLTSGPRRDRRGQRIGHRTRPEFLSQIRDLIDQDVIDIMLTSAGNMEALNLAGAFVDRAVQPAFRANETTDVWANIRGAGYASTPSVPHCGADLEFAPAALCLYSVTFLNDAEADTATLRAYARFRRAAQEKGIQHFLEVFNPNVNVGLAEKEIGPFITDCILRMMASMTSAERPEFLKVAYNGASSMEELAGFDPSLVVGVLGGAGATHRDTFELVTQSEKHGARIALFGRKINQAEDQGLFIKWMRQVADCSVEPEDAVKGYQADLIARKITPDRPLEDDLLITASVLAV